MTFRDLKEKVALMSEKQLEATVQFQYEGSEFIIVELIKEPMNDSYFLTEA